MDFPGRSNLNEFYEITKISLLTPTMDYNLNRKPITLVIKSILIISYYYAKYINLNELNI